MTVSKKKTAKILIIAFLLLCVGYIYNEDSKLSRFLSSEQEKSCDSWCHPHSDPWDMKCTFKHCNGCGQCLEQEDDKPLEDGSSNDLLSAIPTSVKTIDVYGGSVTRGDQFFDHENKRFSALLGNVLGIDVKNKGIAGAGPSQNLLCGIYEADIIISEYRFNEHDGKILDQWYKLIAQKAKHVVILDLWSWLTPPGKSATFEAFERIKDKSKFSVLNLAEQDKNVWPCLVPSLFDYRSPEDFTFWSKIPEECYAYAEGEECNSDKAKQAIADRSGTSAMASLRSSCNPNETPNHALHGTPSYHKYVADQLVHHFQNVVFPQMKAMEDATHDPVIRQGMEEADHNSVCFGEWGTTTQSEEKKLQAIVIENNGFESSSPFSGRKDKVTLNTNVENASVVLSCPEGYDEMKLAWVAHNVKEETVTFSVKSLKSEVEPSHLSTSETSLGGSVEGKMFAVRRVLIYSQESWQPPVKVTLSGKQSDSARLEVGNVLCSHHSTDRRLLNSLSDGLLYLD